MGFFFTRLIAKLLLNKQYLKILVLSDGLFVDYPAFLINLCTLLELFYKVKKSATIR